jgi:hypothetical protein
MGMDVIGKQPTAPVGEYFRNSVWGWHPLWDYVEEVAPHLAEGVVYGHSNDGDGLTAKAASRLAEILTEELESGRTGKYAEEHRARLAAMPDKPCSLCGGTGTRSDQRAQDNGWDTPGGCNACSGKGKVRPWDTWYSFDADNVTGFRNFVAASGGFEIW